MSNLGQLPLHSVVFNEVLLFGNSSLNLNSKSNQDYYIEIASCNLRAAIFKRPGEVTPRFFGMISFLTVLVENALLFVVVSHTLAHF